MLGKLEAAVGQNPWDRILRLVYADCLDDHGEFEAAKEQRQAARKQQKSPIRRRTPEGKETAASTDNSTLHQRQYRRQLRFAARCDICDMHRGCNVSRRPAHISWKKFRKQRWKPK